MLVPTLPAKLREDEDKARGSARLGSKGHIGIIPHDLGHVASVGIESGDIFFG